MKIVFKNTCSSMRSTGPFPSPAPGRYRLWPVLFLVLLCCVVLCCVVLCCGCCGCCGCWFGSPGPPSAGPPRIFPCSRHNRFYCGQIYFGQLYFGQVFFWLSQADSGPICRVLGPPAGDPPAPDPPCPASPLPRSPSPAPPPNRPKLCSFFHLSLPCSILFSLSLGALLLEFSWCFCKDNTSQDHFRSVHPHKEFAYRSEMEYSGTATTIELVTRSAERKSQRVK